MTRISAATAATTMRRSRARLRSVVTSRAETLIDACRARAIIGSLRRATVRTSGRSAPGAADTAAHPVRAVRRMRTRQSGRAGPIGSRSSKRGASGGGSGTSGGAAAKKPCSSSLHEPDRSVSVATSA